MEEHKSRKVVLIPVEQSGEIWGYSYLLFELSYTNIKAFRKYKEIFNKVKKIDSDVTNLTYHNYNINFTLLTDEFDFGLEYKLNVVRLKSLGELQLDKSINSIEEPYYGLEKSPYIKVGLHGISFCYYAVGSNDEVYSSLSYETLDDILKDI